jgi:hypothetical protein
MGVKWPDPMPEEGRLAQSSKAYATGLMLVTDPCMSCPQTLNISLFFDGTNNNDDNAIGHWRDSKINAHTNVARLFNAAIDKQGDGVFKVYIPGVGTPFSKIGEDFYSQDGKAIAKGFDPRCVWAYTRLLNAVYLAIVTDKTQVLIHDAPEAKQLCDAGGPVAAFKRYLDQLGAAHKQAVDEARQPQTVKKIWINVIGFSRGAAGARAFVHKLVNEWAPGGKLGDQAGKYALHYEVNFMGLFDTVASVNLPDSTRPVLNLARFTGHSEWSPKGTKGMTFAAKGAMNIPPQVRFCYHAFSIHEQRMSFPLDSIRMGSSYPAGHRVEIAYPGVHSDVGGGYGPGEQGKACDDRGVGIDSRKLSQIALHDMYIAALECGVPLVSGVAIDNTPRVSDDFAIAPETIRAFNTWLRAADPISTLEDAMKFGMGQMLNWRTMRATPGGDYVTERLFYQFAKEDAMTPYQVDGAVEKAKQTDPVYQALNQQLAHANQQREAINGPNSASNLAGLNDINDQINSIKATQKLRIEALSGEVAHPGAKSDDRPNTGRPGELPRDIGTNDKTDLRQGAEEMRLLLSYLYPAQRERWAAGPPPALRTSVFPSGRDSAPSDPSLSLPRVAHDKPSESPWMTMVDVSAIAGHAIRSVLAQKFDAEDDVVSKPVRDATWFLLDHTSDTAVKNLKRLPEGVITLYDDYIHDSRCWFRLPWFHEYAPGGYFWPRVVFTGNDDRTAWLVDPMKVAVELNQGTVIGIPESELA